VELKIVLWSKQFAQVGPCGLRFPVMYSDTEGGAPNEVA
jgi:hypothetical protein